MDKELVIRSYITVAIKDSETYSEALERVVKSIQRMEGYEIIYGSVVVIDDSYIKMKAIIYMSMLNKEQKDKAIARAYGRINNISGITLEETDYIIIRDRLDE